MINPFAPPIDLSHLPNYRQTDARPRRAVFLGRVSTKDRQLPASSIPRQVVLAAERLDQGEEFIAHFWDVESGMLPAHLRAWDRMRCTTGSVFQRPGTAASRTSWTAQSRWASRTSWQSGPTAWRAPC
ncbi:hypothetical protein ACF082_34360 [Streptomyces lydicus]|uniref:hypothetical protein n=1 Tax=Streptomyces lydicus TaxID=47763 RepID=UPI0036F67468